MTPAPTNFGEFLQAWCLDTAHGMTQILAGRVAPYQSGEARPNPRLAYRQISGNDGLAHMQGIGGMSRQTHQVDIWADDEKTARQIAKLLKGTGATQGLDRYKGVYNGLTVDFCRMQDERTFSSVPQGGTGVPKFCVSQDYEFWFREV